MNKEYFFISKPRCASTHIYEGLTNWNDKINHIIILHLKKW